MVRVLGVDPGSRITGYGVVESGPPPRAIAWGELRLPEREGLPRRLHTLYQGLSALLDRFAPEALALEEVIPERFPRAALTLGQAQGVVLLLAARADLPVFTYHPAVIKQALTGNGRAPKHQVAYMVRALLALNGETSPDAADALAVALTHILREEGCFQKFVGE
ncbi:crossover junction endodeoxyribonuclease RuvC [Thermosulfurimonas sp. F29]|uniref:crossover junction endodeoxyribonuclease RuvC n=1 Tax=Thermosulfurimonas sp. F29 TaxID=2867247 RepID=UPI001C8403AD|nr:crossover junction endodeoxyribonuclease RuvC [Thermosulfurimonas sp. F29]MBX6422512.1 crossover junction endodeoxyribonuclease RuvC [Thermosulfurimonas sp. F29]